jgi:hypothetical protein
LFLSYILNSILFFNAHDIQVTNSIIELTDGRIIAAVKLELIRNFFIAPSRLSTINWHKHTINKVVNINELIL